MSRPNWNSGQVSDWGRSDSKYSGFTALNKIPVGTNVGFYNNAPGVASGGASNGTCAQRARWWLWSTDRLLSIQIYITVSTLEAGATLRVGLYNVDERLQPTTLIEDCGTLDASSTGTKFVNATAKPLGTFCVAAWASNHATVRYNRGASVIGEGQLFLGDNTRYNGNYTYCWGVNSVDYSGGLPAVAPSVSAQSLTTNLIMPGVAFS
jgi:hypothetical protein